MIILEPLSVWRLVLIGLFSILVGMRLYFRHRFRRVWHPPRPREEGLLVLLLHGALVLFLWVVTLLVMSRPGWISWALFQAPLWLRLVGVGLSASGLLLIGWSHVHLGKEFDTTIDASRHQVLVVTGPYQYIRHPLYVAFLFSLSERDLPSVPGSYRRLGQRCFSC